MNKPTQPPERSERERFEAFVFILLASFAFPLRPLSPLW
jgi:hypothetical protein